MARIETRTVDYGDNLKGYHAHDADRTGPRPGVIVIHEWWGLDDYIKGRADMLAGLGYSALAIDMYGGGLVAPTPDEAGAAMNAVLGDIDLATRRLEAGYACLAGQPHTDPARLGAIGYCFGGAMVLHMARIGMDLKAVASFHGALGSFHEPAPGSVKAKVLVCHGADDKLVPDEDVASFKREMSTARADLRFVAYPGALHGFSNPAATGRGEQYGLPLRYDEQVDRQSWAEMKKLFAEVLD